MTVAVLAEATVIALVAEATGPAVASLAVSGLVTAGLCPWVISWLRGRSIVDAESARTSHVGVVPRGGGVALLIGMAAGLTLTAESWMPTSGLLVLALAAVGFAVLGLRDDVGGLRPSTRLVAQIAISLVFAFATTWSTGMLGLLGAALVTSWLVLFVNAFNFMDGINGISAATTAIIAGSLAVASIRWDGGVEVPALALVGAALAFAPFNAANRVFLGDVGSYLLGASLSMLAVIGVLQGIPVLAAVLPFGLYVADVIFTLARRLTRHAPLMESHREHVYQRLANEGGWGHERTTMAVSVCTLILALLANLGAEVGVGIGGPALWSLSAVVVVTYLRLPGRAVRVRA